MRYECEVIIDRPRAEVISMFDSRENLSKWQPTLKSAEPLSGEPGQAGATMKLIYLERGRETTMTETIESNELPDSFAATYTAKGVVNPCRNTFTELPDGRTRWKMDTEFRLSGMMALMGLVMRGAFTRQTELMMNNFKTWVESA